MSTPVIVCGVLWEIHWEVRLHTIPIVKIARIINDVFENSGAMMENYNPM